MIESGGIVADRPRSPRDLPLAVDLDGTLVRTDTLHEQLAMVAHRPLTMLRVASSLVQGRAAFKAALAAVAPVAVETLPYREDLLAFVRQERSRGRPVALVTAANGRTARAVADHLGCFSEVLASDDRRNLKGKVKADALVERFGLGGFCYAGDAQADLPVWQRAGAAIPVEVPARVRRAVAGRIPIEREFRSTHRKGALVRMLRPHQWVKNGLVLVPAIAANALGMATLRAASLAFVSFCLVASALYIWNDLLDIEVDRRHPTKRRRPLASAEVRVVTAWWMVVTLLAGGLLLGTWAGAAVPLATYALLSTAYSAVLKTFPLVDAFVLAGLYSVRLWGGAVATTIQLSVWLIAFSSFTFLSLAVLKRVGELHRPEPTGIAAGRRGYQESDLGILTTIGIGSAFAAAVVLSLYLESAAAATRYAHPALLWFLVPLLLFWVCRLWLATGRGYMHDDPVAYSLRDWVSWLVGLAAVATIVGARL